MSDVRRLAVVALVASLAAGGVLAEAAAQQGDTDRVLTKITFIHFRGAHAKPDKPGGGKPTQDGYYAYLAKGCRWKTPENFVLNPLNGDGVPPEFVQQAVAAGMNEWEKYGGTAIFGTLALDGNAAYNDSATDGVNAFSFGPLPLDIIAVTTVWGYFGGPVQTREIVEADMLFNDAYLWGDGEANPSLMDLQNIATHELGHVAGMDDLYIAGAFRETMYGYSDEGDIAKRDLYNGDITGIKKLYGQ